MSRLEYRRKKQKKQHKAEKRLASNPANSRKRITVLLSMVGVVMLLTVLILFLNSEGVFISMVSSADEPLAQETLSTVPCNVSSVVSFIPYQDGVLLCGKDGIKFVNGEGSVAWQVSVSLNNPFVSVKDGYILLSEYGGKAVYIYQNDTLVLTSHTDYSILNAKMETGGYFITVVDEPYFRGMVTLRSIADEPQFVWHSGSAYVIDVALRGDGRQLAAATVGAQAPLGAGISVFDISDEQPKYSHTFEDCIISNVRYNADGSITAVADDKLIGIAPGGEVRWNVPYNGVLKEATFDGDNVLLLLEDTAGSGAHAAVVSSTGKEKALMDADGHFEYANAFGGRILCGYGNVISVYNHRGNKLYHIAAHKDVRKVVLFNKAKSALVVGNTSVDIIAVK